MYYMKDRKNIIYLLAILLVTLLITIGISFAYIVGSQTSQTGTNVNVIFNSGVVADFNVTGNGNLLLNISGNQLLEDSKDTIIANDETNITVSLKSDMNVACSYDIYFNWITDAQNQYTALANDEMTLSGNSENYNFLNVQVPNYNSSKKIGTYTISADKTTTTQNWSLSLNFKNLNIIQDIHENKTYKGKISVENAVCNAVSYKLSEARTFNATEYLDTGYKIDWDKDFTIDEVINIPTSSLRYLVIGGYNGSSAKEMNVEVTAAGQLRTYIAINGVHDLKNGLLPYNTDIRILFKWNASNDSYSVTATNVETGEVVATINSGYSMSGNALNGLRIGCADYRSSNTTFKTMSVKSLIIY